MQKALFLYNPAAGRGRIARNVGGIVDIFSENGWELTPEKIDFGRNPFDAHPDIRMVVAAGGDDHPDVGMRVERVASEVDLFGREFPPVFGEDVHDAPDVAGDAAASCGGIVEKERFLHG